MGWGQLFFLPCLRVRLETGIKRLQDNFQTSVCLLQHIMVPEAQHLKALLLQVAAAPIIFCLLFCMLSAIQFDDQAGFQAGEVGDVWPYCMLSTKLVAMQLPGSQPSPQMLFSIGHLCAQLAGVLGCLFVAHAPILAFPRSRGKEFVF